MIWYIIIAVVYLIIAIGAYDTTIKKWDNKKWEKILFSLFWIGVLPLYGIYKLHLLW